MWPFTTVLAGLTLLELLRQPTQDPLLGSVPTHILPNSGNHNQHPVSSWAPEVSLTLPATLPELSRELCWIIPAHSSQLILGIVLPQLYLTIYPN